MEKEEKELTAEEIWAELEAENFPEAEPPSGVVPKEEPPEEPGASGLSGEQPPKEEPPATPPAINPELQAKFDALNEKLDAISGLNERMRKTEGNVGTLMDQIKKTREDLDNQPTPEQTQKALELEKKLEALATDDPDLWEGINSKVAPLQEEVNQLKEALDKVTPPEEDLNALVTTKAEELFKDRIQRERDEELEYLQSVKPDYMSVLNSNDFKDWHKKQSPDVQALIRSYQAKDYLLMFRKYDQSKAKADANQERLDQATTPPKDVADPPRQKKEEEMTLEEMWEQSASEIWSD